ncbi:hypothetical protein ABIE44_003111 [Marmoricola sp. OAE513]|uniref:NAD(P)/FAD-dependent oxidoreductase n=1 Tax=Marmoricola sp. OAE513 TaxID=2817894 RepID=UPI001AE242B1
MRSELPVVVVGAGLAGLACAGRLAREGVAVVVLEAGDGVGGRMRTERVDGFTIDRGFQVLNTAYPALRSSGVLDALDLRFLPRGVRVRRDGRLHDVPHPLASATAPLRALTSGVAGARDKLDLARYAGALVAAPTSAIKDRVDVPATQAWASALSPEVVEGVLVPFLTGVVLEEDIGTSRVFTDLMMRMFARGTSAVPARGVQELPRHLASRLPPETVRLEAPVVRVAPFSVELEDGSELDARAVVVAVDPWAAHRLVPGLGHPPAARGVSTHYFAAPPWAGSDGTLVVDADRSGIANSVVLTESAPEYARDGRALIATSVVHGGSGADLTPDQVAVLAAELHETSASRWEHLVTRDVAAALPAMPAPHPLRKPVYVPDAGVWVAGDHRDTSSIQGALVSGRRTASEVLRHVTLNRAAS